MLFKIAPNLLQLALIFSLPLLPLAILRPSAHGSVSLSSPPQKTPLLTQFEPTSTEPLDAETVISTTGGRYFQPPPEETRRPSGPRTTTGTRSGSCSRIADGIVFSGLGPRSMVGLTTSVRPEFMWYITEIAADAPMLFRLLAIDETGQATVVDSAELSAQAGFMRYRLPDSVAALEVGKDYLWQVIVRCDPGRLSSVWTSTLSLQVVNPTPALTDALAMATTDAEQAIIYGNAGIWYDALALVASGKGTADQTVRTGLLQDLASLESDDAIVSNTLMTIVEQTSVDGAP